MKLLPKKVFIFLSSLVLFLAFSNISFAQTACTRPDSSTCPAGQTKICTGEIGSNGVCEINDDENPNASCGPCVNITPTPSSNGASTTTSPTKTPEVNNNGTPVSNPDSAPNNTSTSTSNNPSKSQDWTAGKQGSFTIAYPLLEGILCTTTMINPVEDCAVQRYKNGGKPGANGKPEVELAFTNGRLGGAMGTLTTLAGALYDAPPVSTGYYLADLGKQLKVVPEAYAQGVQTDGIGGSGDAILYPVLALWKTMRNFAYLMFIIIFLIVGFMIMFRQKINPQTVISVQAALPGLVTSLILITFSYFLASLMVDVAFLGMQLVVELFISSGTHNALGGPDQLRKIASDSNLLDLFRTSFRYSENAKNLNGGIHNVLQTISSNTFGADPTTTSMGIGGIAGLVIAGLVAGITALPIVIGGALVGGAIGAASQGVFSTDPLSGVISLIVPVVLIVGLLIQFFRLFFQLIEAYISILIFTILGPIYIMASAIPGHGSSLSTWWRNILGNALIFPAVFAIFLMAGMILGMTDPNAWRATPPLFGGLPTDLLRIIIAYAFIMGSPAVPGMVKKAMKVSEFGEIAKAAQGGFQAGQSVVTGGVNQLFNPLIQRRAALRKAYESIRFEPDAAKRAQAAAGISQIAQGSPIYWGIKDPGVGLSPAEAARAAKASADAKT